MKKALYVGSFIYLLFAIGCSSGKEDEPVNENQDKTEISTEEAVERDVTRGINLNEAQKQLVGRNNDFSFNLCRQLNQSDAFQGKSLFVSPISCTYALGMLNNGAKGQTNSEVLKLLGFENSSNQDVNELCQALIIEAPLVDDKVALKLANTVIANDQIELQDTYQKDVKDYYRAEIFSKDFSQAATLTFINDWCREHTDGMIPSILDILDPSACAILMNAVYFKAEWSGKFKREETIDDTFTKEDGSRVVLPIMHRHDATYYTSNDLYATIGMPYGNGNRWSMYVLLPQPGKTVTDVLNSLTQRSWNENKIRLMGTQVDVRLPRFRAESNITLNDAIQRLGAVTMFSSGADFSAMTVSRDFSVSLIIQKTVAEITEEGTEASAVTAIVTSYDNIEGNEPPAIQFHATRPFVYLIQEETSGAIFFIGSFAGE